MGDPLKRLFTRKTAKGDIGDNKPPLALEAKSKSENAPNINILYDPVAENASIENN